MKHIRSGDPRRALKKNMEQQTHRTLSQTFSDPNDNENRKNKVTVIANNFPDITGETVSKDENNYLASVEHQTVLRNYRGNSIDGLIAKEGA